MPATHRAPDYLASNGSDDGERASVVRGRTGAVRMAARRLTEHARLAPLADDSDADAGIEAEIESIFRMKLSGIRRLPPRERVHAVRAARLWRNHALLAMREKRDRERRARHAERRMRMPEPT